MTLYPMQVAFWGLTNSELIFRCNGLIQLACRINVVGILFLFCCSVAVVNTLLMSGYCNWNRLISLCIVQTLQSGYRNMQILPKWCCKSRLYVGYFEKVPLESISPIWQQIVSIFKFVDFYNFAKAFKKLGSGTSLS